MSFSLLYRLCVLYAIDMLYDIIILKSSISFCVTCGCVTCDLMCNSCDSYIQYHTNS